MTGPPPRQTDFRRAFRTRDGRLLVVLGGALAAAAVLISALAQHDLDRKERQVATLQVQLDSVRALRTAPGNDDAAFAAEITERERYLGSARLHLEEARASRADLWGWKGPSMLLAVVGGLLVGAGFATLRRARAFASSSGR